MGWRVCHIPQDDGAVPTARGQRFPSGLKATLFTQILYARSRADRWVGGYPHPTG